MERFKIKSEGNKVRKDNCKKTKTNISTLAKLNWNILDKIKYESIQNLANTSQTLFLKELNKGDFERAASRVREAHGSAFFWSSKNPLSVVRRRITPHGPTSAKKAGR